jgi:preprotein translocase subunit YajC
MKRRSLIAGLLLLCTSVLLYAHGGMIHVMGTVTRITDNSVTVETTDKKTVEVQLTDSTTYMNGSNPGSRKEIKVGDRVAIHAVKVKDSLQAHEVHFNAAPAASSH